MARTVLITGATGLLGREVLRAFKSAGWNAVGTGFTRATPPRILKLDLSDQAAVKSMLDEVKPDAVIHCAANRFPDKCDLDPAGTRRLNVEATSQLAQATSNRGALLLYISTDYVFQGRPGEAPYEADAEPAPANFYGQTKLDGETATLEATQETGLGIILRVPLLYGHVEERQESSVNALLDTVWKAAKEPNAQIKMDHWAQRYPTNTEDVARVCLDVATKYLDEDRHQLPKILQFSSEDRHTKYEICEMYARIMALPLDGMVANKEAGDPEASVQRPYDTHLSTKALRDIGIKVHTQSLKDWWRRELGAYRK